MAYFRQLKNGTWQAQVQHLGHRLSKAFETKNEARLWATETSKSLKKEVKVGIDHTKTFDGVALKYIKEVSAHKKGARWEEIRLKAIIRDEHFAGVKFAKIDSTVISQWRDYRLKTVKPSTVNRELNLLSGLFTKAIREWRIITENPVSFIKRPKDPPHRERIITDQEIEAFLDAIPFTRETKAKNNHDFMAVAFLFAIETAMRCGEICSLTKESINGSVARLTQTKNGKPRDVPLSKEALRLLTLLPEDNEPLFGLKTSQVDILFRKYRDKLDQDYTFHDTRHLAITRLAKKLDVLSLAKVVGHSNPKQLMTYYNPSAKELAKLLD